MYVVGADGSGMSDAALRWALRHGDAVHVVRVWPGYGTHARDDDEVARRVAGERYALDASVARSAGGGTGVTRELRCGRPADELLAAAEGAEALVLGRSGLRGIEGALLGSVPRECIVRARVPVVVVPGTDPDPPTGRVAVGVSDDPAALAAVEWAAGEAARRGAVLVAVRAHGGIAFADPEVTDEYEHEIARQLVGKVSPEGPVEYRVVEGDVVPVLLAEAARCDLLVVGTRAHGTVLPTTVSRLADAATVPLVVVR